MKNILNKVRAKDKKKIAKQGLKKDISVYFRRKSFECFQSVQEKVGRQVPKGGVWEHELYKLLTFLKYLESIHRIIYTTNLIKRTIKEIKKKVKVTGALQSTDTVEKLVYLRLAMLNDKRSNRVVNGFLETKEDVWLTQNY